MITRPLLRDEGMAENHGAPEAGQFTRVWTRGRTATFARFVCFFSDYFDYLGCPGFSIIQLKSKT